MLATEQQLADWDRAMRRGTDGGRGPKAPSTRALHQQSIRLIETALEGVNVDSNGGLLEATLRYLDQQRDIVSPSMVNRYRQALISLFTATGREDWVEDIPPRAPSARPHARVPADEDVHALLTYPWPTHHQVMFRLMAHCALRVSEAASAAWKHVDWTQGWLFVPEAKCGSRRRVPLWTTETMEKMQGLLRGLQTKAPSETPWLFPKSADAALHLETVAVRVALWRACQHLGLPRISPHDLRRWFATLAVRQEMHISYLQAILGHRDLATTQYYTAPLSDGLVKDAYGRLELDP